MHSSRFIKLNYNNIEGIAQISLHRPPVNALNNIIQLELTSIFQKLLTEPNVRMVIFKVNKCAGIDLQEFINSNEIPKLAFDFATLFDTIASFNKPIIGVMQGPLIGAGTTLAALCSHTIVSAESRFGYPECFFGLKPFISAPYVVHKMGNLNAIHYFSTGSIFSASTALSMNLVNEVCEINLVESILKKRMQYFLSNPKLPGSYTHALAQNFEGAAKYDPDMAKLASTAIDLYTDRSITGRKILVQNTSQELAKACINQEVKTNINNYLNNKDFRRSL